MTHPLTPREKVAEIVEAAILRHYPTAVISDTLDDASDILTALTSGSGDHAELARLARIWSDTSVTNHKMPGDTAVIWSCRLEALLAENAALRINEKAALKECSEWARKAGEAIGRLETSEAAGIVEGWQDRATEAERKLAEAVGLNERAADLMRQCTDPERFEGASTLNVYANMRAWLSSLSKEAERG